MKPKRLFVTVTILFSLLFPNFPQAQAQRPKVVSIPDANLAAAIRQEIGDSITTDTLLNLTRLEVRNREIKNLTGLEHAHNLERLELGSEYIKGEGFVNSNTISDLSPLVGLSKLAYLNLARSGISDISPLVELTQLTELYLHGNNNISDISALSELTQLNILEFSGNEISDLSPLSGLTQLISLVISGDEISDLSPLSGLTQLTGLSISGTSISDISPLSELTQLTHLTLWNTSTSDISVLSGLTQLTFLELTGNEISDVSVLSGLTQLTYLNLGWNTISDVSPLSGLTQLNGLDLTSNEISDLSPLLGLTQLKHLNILGNPLSYASINTHIPAIQAKGIEVEFQERIPTTLRRISDAAQEGVVNTALPFPFVVEVLDQRWQTFAGVPVTFAVTAGSGKLRAETANTDAMGIAAAHLTLGQTEGTTTVRVTATDISEPVEFTAMAIRRSSPVAIPDANLRMKIMETLRKSLDEAPTASDMLTLTTLTANDADILELTGLQHASNLTRLSLENNRISNVSPLAGLTQLTTLNLRNNRISDVLPLIGSQLKGAKEWNELYLQGNPLNDISINTHIPMLQAAGVNVRFDSILTQSRPMIVRLIYFLPRDRQPQPDINAKMDRLIKDVQQFYTEQMENHGFGRKTFQFETDARGNAVVYHINGKLDDVHYQVGSGIVWREIDEQFDTSKNIYLTALDVSTEIIGRGNDNTACGTGGGGNHSGGVLIPAFGGCFNFSTAAHELGHALGLGHDFRDGAYIMSYGPGQNRLSPCTAEWLDVHRAFNPGQTTADKHNEWAAIEMLPPSFVAPPNTIRFRFKVSDSEGIHQVQLITPTLRGPAEGQPELVNYNGLNGTPNKTVEFVTTDLVPANKSLSLQVIDKRGNMSWSERYSIDVASLLPPAEVISIPDANLAAAIREVIGDSITTHTLLNLTRLDAPNQGITDLTGLEHAHNLRGLHLRGEDIDERTVNSNVVSDFTPLVTLTKLRRLDLSDSSLSDISSLAKLTQLTYLNLSNNPISNVSALAGLTKLNTLYLAHTSVLDLSALSGLTQLFGLSISGTSVPDLSALSGLTQLNRLYLSGNEILDVSPLAGLTQLTYLHLSDNDISDISPLEGLTQLRELNLLNNAISDISVLSELTQLRELNLLNNAISDISVLSELTQLKLLFLSGNSILDVSPLVGLNLTGTAGSSIGLYIEGNPLNYASLNTHIPAMQAKGIKIKYDLNLTKITGPWLWMIAPTEPGQGGWHSINVDSLDAASDGAVTEEEVAANGATAGDIVGDYAWKLGKIAADGANNINDLLNNIGMAQGDINDHSSYALITLESATAQPGVTMRAETDDAIKVWLNGEVVHNYPIIDHDGADFTVDLEKGDNLLLVKVSERAGIWNMFVGIEAAVNAVYKRPPDAVLSADVNGDGVVNIQDLVFVSSSFGQTGENAADVNGDGVVNISDLVLVAGAFGEEAAAAPTLHASDLKGFTAEKLQDLLTQARQLALTDPAYLRGITVLEQLLAHLLPKKTALLPNYPNPFNPETWIPYQLAKPAEVTLHIYAVNGALVRTLTLGHQPAGMYHGKSRAVYWDGQNAQGEAVASGVYFYTLSAGDFTKTRKMVISK